MELWLLDQLFWSVYHTWVLTGMNRCWDDESGREKKRVMLRYDRPDKDDNVEKWKYLHDFFPPYLSDR